MRPIEFVLWLNRIAEFVGNQPPTPEQWTAIRERLGKTVGNIVAARLSECAEEYEKVLGLAHVLLEIPELSKSHNRVSARASTR